jgi:hypothetical protein
LIFSSKVARNDPSGLRMAFLNLTANAGNAADECYIEFVHFQGRREHALDEGRFALNL